MDNFAIKLPPSMVAKVLARREKAAKIESPEVNYVVQTALDKLIQQQAAKQKHIQELPIHEVLAKEAPLVPVEEVLESESVEEDRELDGAELVEYDAPADESKRYYEDEISEGNRHLVLGIPAREEARLVPTGFVLDESQQRAIDNLLTSQYGCLIGAAGTGKTTVTKFLVDKLIYDPDSTFKAKKILGHLNIAFVAFTGMAVQVIKENLPEWLHQNCMTIHSLLEFMPQESQKLDPKTGQVKVTMPFMPMRNEDNPLDYDLIIVDEASMLGMDLWNQFRVACREGTRVIFIGDLNQLPPIIGESIFAYALGHWTVSELTHIHRQKGPGASKIIDIAHKILRGEGFLSDLDKMKGNPDWRVAGAVVDPKAKKAAEQILVTCNNLRKLVFEDGRPVYDPYRDRIMTAGNGYDDNRESSLVQQAPLNEALALLITPYTDDNPRFMIDAGKGITKHFSVGNRVMATRNESPAKKDRVTNGLTGTITKIVKNAQYTGKSEKYGPEHEVAEHMRIQFALHFTPDTDEANEARRVLAEEASYELDLNAIAEELSTRLAGAESDEEIEKASGDSWASHTVYVKFANGAEREYWSKTQLEQLQLAYASTVAKCQGSQFPTAIIVIHDAVKEQLCREWLYTAVTRAQSHVILFYTDYAMRLALSKQKIWGATIQEKIDRYRRWMTEGVKNDPMAGLMRKSVYLQVGPSWAVEPQ